MTLKRCTKTVMTNMSALMDMALMAMKRLKKMEFLTIWKKVMRSTPAALLYQ